VYLYTIKADTLN